MSTWRAVLAGGRPGCPEPSSLAEVSRPAVPRPPRVSSRFLLSPHRALAPPLEGLRQDEEPGTQTVNHLPVSQARIQALCLELRRFHAQDPSQFLGVILTGSLQFQTDPPHLELLLSFFLCGHLDQNFHFFLIVDYF